MSAPSSTSEEEGLLRAEIERLGRERVVLERQWAKKYWLSVFALAAVPVYFLAGGFWAVVTVAMTPALVATQAYLLMIRRSEVAELLGEAKHALAALRGPARSEGDGRAPRRAG